MKQILWFSLFFSLAASAAPDCSKKMGDRPNKSAKPGTVNTAMPIEHIVVLMQENHSFDNYFGKLNQPQFYGSAIDGVLDTMWNPDQDDNKVFAHHEETLCVSNPKHDWESMHSDWDNGKNDQFVVNNNNQTIGYFDQTDIPFYYALANRFAVADRYFASAMTQTYPNRFYLLTGTSFGHVENDPVYFGKFSQKTIFELLTENGISWKYYNDGSGYFQLFKYSASTADKIVNPSQFVQDLNSGKLPQVSFIDASDKGEDEHPSADIQQGQVFVAQRIKELTQSPYWANSVLFLAYDENGGFFDHVAPPAACAPDSIGPNRFGLPTGGDFQHYGFRVPFVAVSPFAKTHYVSHKTYDHTSILRFIETKFNLPALTSRDANADDLSDLFDYSQSNLSVDLPSGAMDPAKACKDSIF